MKKIGIMLIIMSLFTVACGKLYTIDPGIVDTSDSSTKVEVNVQDNQEELVDQGPSQEELDKAKEEAQEKEAQEKEAQEERDRLAAEEEEAKAAEEEEAAREEIVDQLFVNQFSSNEPYTLDVDISELDNTETSWSFKRNTTHEPVTGYYDVDLSLFGAYFHKTTDEKVMYLTFDEGYEEGYTPKILDILKENNVKATFFITSYYLKSEPDLVKRMIAEGHIVANHSVNHPSFPTLTDEEVYDELTVLANEFKEVTGTEMAPFFRPPSGKYSERTLYLARKLGYRTIFWAMAYGDWDPDNQPGKEAAYEHVLTNYNNGAIILLHAVSESNTEALDDILKDLKDLGYRFGSLYELE